MFGLTRKWPRRTAQLAAAGMLAASGSMFFASVATAAPGAPADKVTICHRTDSNTNPYVTITVSIDAADGSLGNGNNDHTHHMGPVWDPTLKDKHQKWGDIIPPYDFGAQHFNGLNWTAAGQAIWNAGCGVPSGGSVTASGHCTTNTIGSGYTWAVTATPALPGGPSNVNGTWSGGGNNGTWSTTNGAGTFTSPAASNSINMVLGAGFAAAGWTLTQPSAAPAACGNAAVTPADATAAADCNALTAHLIGGSAGATFDIVHNGVTDHVTVPANGTQDVSYGSAAGATITVSVAGVQKASAQASNSCGGVGAVTPPSATASADCTALSAHLDAGTNATTFTVNEPGGSHSVSVPAGSTQNVSYGSGNGATITVSVGATVLDTKSAPTDCTTTSPGLSDPALDESNHCKSGMNVTLSNMNGTADTTFTVVDPDGVTHHVAVRAGQLKKLAFAVKEDTTGTLSVSAPGLAKKTFTYNKDCATVLGVKHTRHPHHKPPVKPVVQGEHAQLPFTGFDTKRALLDGAAVFFLGAVLCILGSRRRDEELVY